jgi:hypothetical protein
MPCGKIKSWYILIGKCYKNNFFAIINIQMNKILLNINHSRYNLKSRNV